MTDVRVNVLVLAFIGGLLLWLADVDTTVVAAFIGALGAVMLRLCEPAPNPQVDANALAALLSSGAVAMPDSGWRMRWNILALAIIGAAVVFFVVKLAGVTAPTMAIAAAYVGALGAAMAKMVDPEEPTVPASVVMAVIEANRGAPPGK